MYINLIDIFSIKLICELFCENFIYMFNKKIFHINYDEYGIFL